MNTIHPNQGNGKTIFNICPLVLLLCLAIPYHISAQNSCNFQPGESINLSISNNSTQANYTTHYVLVNSAGTIAYSQPSSTFTGVVIGGYFAYGITYDNTETAPNLTVGTDINAIGGNCIDMTSPFPVGVCDCTHSSSSVSVNHTGFNNTADYTTVYVLTDKNFNILSTQSNTNFTGLIAGIYNVFAVNYDSSDTPPDLSIGGNILSIEEECIKVSDPLGFVNCTCSLNAPTVISNCNDNGTPANKNDDFIDFSVHISGGDTNSSYSISATGQTITNLSAPNSYGTIEYFRLEEGSASGSGLLITITDNTDSSCTRTASVSSPGTCSYECDTQCVSVSITKK